MEPVTTGSWRAAIEAQAFSLKRPGTFFNMFAPPRSDTAFKSARDQLEEELQYASKVVRRVHRSLVRIVRAELIRPDRECVRDPQRIPFHPLLPAIESPASGAPQAACVDASTAPAGRQWPMEDEPRAWW